ncbi:hypothetical protein EXIGLDRAFT_779552 [Exidia glandulosa HHB12029]|uniref:DUF7330 domain-containing protein n=1 Tax=Exidia glandulosa HHB12029 TaxID=1314781 RepID=A0A165BZX4_EXIGL|nr:hypothetical protein EXIGLDRAFT_779552 [Exidia glandulosa HHB12029]
MVAPTSSAREQQHDIASAGVQAVPPVSAPRQTPAARGKRAAHRPPPPVARSNWVSVARVGKFINYQTTIIGVTARRQAVWSTPEPFIGSYVLDPSMAVTSELLSPRSEEDDDEERPNLKVDSTGDIDIDLWIVPSSAEDGSKAATRVVLDGRNIKLRLHSIGTRPLDLYISCETLSIAVPRDFVGALGMDTPTKRIKFSAPVTRVMAIFHDAVDGMNGFIGDSSKAGADLAQGSRIVIKSSKSDVSMSFAKPRTIWTSLWPFGKSAA